MLTQQLFGWPHKTACKLYNYQAMSDVSIPIIHDCDPGNDDALGILVALGSPDLALKAVSTGAGHLVGERTVRNAAITLEVAGARNILVTRGALVPLVREPLIAGVLDLKSGLDQDRLDLRAAEIVQIMTSSEMIADIASRVDLTVVTTGPLTNLALALRNRPSTATKLTRIFILGGAWGLGNKTASAEWNILCDPEAAAIVLGSGVPITLIPIDATAQVLIDNTLVSEVAALNGPVPQFAVELLRSLRTTHQGGRSFGTTDMPLNDPLALLVAASPAIARTLPARVDVELSGNLTYGRTVIDFYPKSGLAPNCDVVVEFDVGLTRRAFVCALDRVSEMHPSTLQ